MMGKKRLKEVKKEVAALLSQLPASTPRAWFRQEIESAKADRRRDVDTLMLLCAALDRAKNGRAKQQRSVAKR